MNHELFEWDFENLAHIARHGVTPEEAEEVFAGPVLFLGYQNWNGESRFFEVGRTFQGRILQVLTTRRGSRNRVITAYDPRRSIKLQYLAKVSQG